MEYKPKFDKKKCKRCKYRGRGTGYIVKTGFSPIHCDYARTNDQTCLTRIGKDVIDRRGNDYNNCLLFEEGTPVKESVSIRRLR